MAHCQEKVSWADIDTVAADQWRVGGGGEEKLYGVSGRKKS